MSGATVRGNKKQGAGVAGFVWETVDALVRPLGFESRGALFRAIAEFAARAGGGREPGQDAVRKYIKTNRKLSYGFALLLLDFIDDQCRADGHLGREQAVVDVRSDLVAMINDDGPAHGRFVGPAHSDPACLSYLADLQGTYVVIRRDTGTPHIHQNLLILSHEGRREGRNHATFISADVVGRGTWCVLDRTVYIALRGQRSDYRPDAVAVAFARGTQPGDVLAGCLLGVSSEMCVPAIAPVLAVRVKPDQVHASVSRLPLMNDVWLREAVAGLQTVVDETAPHYPLLSRLLAAIIPAVGPATAGAIARAGDRGERVLDPNPTLLELKRSRINGPKLIVPALKAFLKAPPTPGAGHLDSPGSSSCAGHP